MKIIGLMLTWNNLEFFKCSLQQALDFCDEVWVVDGCHSRAHLWHSTDGTYGYLKTFRHPKLIFVDVDRIHNRYDKVQRFLRDGIPKRSELWKPGNWVFQLDDDLFFFKDDLVKLKEAMSTATFPALTCDVRYFIYNFQLNFLQKGGSVCYKIIDKFVMKGIGYPHFIDGNKFHVTYLKDIIAHHYTYVKKPERMKARWDMSIEKGTKSSKGRFEKWMDIQWDRADNFTQLEKDLERIRPGGGLNVYEDDHPKVLDSHPWLDIVDVRKVE